MQNEPLAPERRENAPTPEISGASVARKSHIRRTIAILGYVAIAILFAYAGYAFRGAAPDDVVSGDASAIVQKSADDLSGEHVPETSGDTLPKSVLGLPVQWSSAYEDIGADWFKQKSYDGIQEIPVTYDLVGRIETEGEFNHASVYLVQVDCEGPCFSKATFRFIRKDDTSYLLSRYSESDLTYYPGEYVVRDDIVLDDLEFPERVMGPDGEELIFSSWLNTRFQLTDRRVLFHSDAVGDVYVEKDSAVHKRYGFYVPVADGTEAVYTVHIPFMSGEETVPRITWSDGIENSFEYFKADIGGCGLTNLAAVVGEDDVTEADLVPVGASDDGAMVWALKDGDNPYLRNIYDTGYALGRSDDSRISYEEFVASKPVVFWRDGFGRLLKFQRAIFQPAVECGKPVIYLYPERETNVSVKVEPTSGMTVSDPAYGDGWHVMARPDGTLTNLADGQSYPYLFWEGRGGLYETPKEGHVIARADVKDFLEEALQLHGLNARETADFMEFWLPRMQEKPYYFVTFMTNRVMDELAPLTIDPKPDVVLRVLMDYLPLDTAIDVMMPRAPRPIVRNGFTVIEWGGVLGR